MFVNKLNINFFIVFIIYGSLLSNAQTSLLNYRINHQFNNKKIPKLIEEIGDITNIGFSYNSDIILNNRISYTSNNNTIKEILDSILNTDSLVFRFEEFENYIIIIRISENIKRDELATYYKGNILTINGLVIEDETNLPIPFAHVYLDNRNTRTITNIDGKFELNISNPTKTDTVNISCIGYETYRQYILSIDTSNKIYSLKMHSFPIEQIVVKPIDPLEIIKKAINNISVNYENSPCVLTAFFRETNRLDDKYLSISEAVLSIYKTNYAINYERDKVKIVKGRKSQNFEPLEDYDFKVVGGLYNNLKLDIVKDKASFIDEEFFEKYNYEYDKIISVNNRPAYLILFDQKDSENGLLYQGELYIDVETYAFAGTEFRISPKAIKNAGAFLIKKKPLSAKIAPVYSHYKTDYIYNNGKWQLSSVKSEIRLRVLNKKGTKYSQFSTLSEFIITDKHVKELWKFKRQDLSKSTEAFVDQIPNEYSSEFWGKYNIIQPDKSLIEAYNELNKNHYIYIINPE